MTRATRFLPLALLLFLFPMLPGCGGDVVASSNTNPSSAVSVAIPESYVTVEAGEGHQFSAAVTGTDNTAVTWSVTNCTGDACGTITAAGYYAAPSHVPAHANIRVRATAQADSSKSDEVTVHQVPIAILVDPMAAWISPGESLKFTATVQHDITKGGVNWSLTCANSPCGTLSDATLGSVVYTAPAVFPDPPSVTLAATSITDSSKTGNVTISASASATLAEGDYAFLFSGWELSFSNGYYSPFRFTVAGHFRADGNGNILDGVEDISSMTGISQSVPITGSYSNGSDRRGILTIVTPEQSAIYYMLLDPSGKRAKFIRFDGAASDTPVSGAGYLELQDRAACSLSALNGDYAMGLSGNGSGHGTRVATVARFTVGSEGAFAGGKMDRLVQMFGGTEPSEFSANLILAGSLGAPSTSTCRGTATLAVSAAQNQAPENLNFVYYVVSNDKLLLVQTDARTAEFTSGSVLSGEARRQHGPFSAASFEGPTIFSMAGLNREGYGAYFERVAVGQMVADGSASMTGVIDDNGYPYPAVTNQPFYGAYTVASDGRSELQLGAGPIDRAVAYFYGPNQAFLMEASPGTDVLLGNIRPQATGPFDASSISGTYLTITAPPTSEEAENECGLTTFDGESSATSSIDVNENLSNDPQLRLWHFDLTGTYDVAPNGRGTLVFSSQSRTVVFWIASPTEIVGNAAMLSDRYSYGDWAALLEFTR